MERRKFTLGLIATTTWPLGGCQMTPEKRPPGSTGSSGPSDSSGSSASSGSRGLAGAAGPAGSPVASGPPSGRSDAIAAAWARELTAIEAKTGGRLGAAMLDTGTGLGLGWRAAERFPMTSTFKLVLAGWMLALVDAGRERLDARLTYGADKVVEYSPVSGPRAGNGGGATVGELCSATVSLSDNTAANLLLERHGGPAAFTAFVRSLGDEVTRLDRYELDLNEAAIGDPRDTTTPTAMLATMQTLVLGDRLTPASRDQLRAWLIATSTGDRRLRAGLPGWRTGDKTGTAPASGTANDVAVAWPPDGGAPLLVTCYLTRATVAAPERDAAIAEVARAAARARSTARGG